MSKTIPANQINNKFMDKYARTCYQQLIEVAGINPENKYFFKELGEYFEASNGNPDSEKKEQIQCALSAYGFVFVANYMRKKLYTFSDAKYTIANDLQSEILEIATIVYFKIFEYFDKIHFNDAPAFKGYVETLFENYHHTIYSRSVNTVPDDEAPAIRKLHQEFLHAKKDDLYYNYLQDNELEDDKVRPEDWKEILERIRLRDGVYDAEIALSDIVQVVLYEENGKLVSLNKLVNGEDETSAEIGTLIEDKSQNNVAMNQIASELFQQKMKEVFDKLSQNYINSEFERKLLAAKLQINDLNIKDIAKQYGKSDLELAIAWDKMRQICDKEEQFIRNAAASVVNAGIAQ